MKLFYVILGATPEGRNIEQHDVFFGIAETLEDLIPEIKEFWKGARIHIDCYQAVQFADGYEVKIVEKMIRKPKTNCSLLILEVTNPVSLKNSINNILR